MIQPRENIKRTTDLIGYVRNAVTFGQNDRTLDDFMTKLYEYEPSRALEIQYALKAFVSSSIYRKGPHDVSRLETAINQRIGNDLSKGDALTIIESIQSVVDEEVTKRKQHGLQR